MIHRELGFGELTAAMMATPGTDLLLPPLRLAKFPSFRSLAFHLFRGDPTLIWHKQEFSTSSPGRPASTGDLPEASGSATEVSSIFNFRTMRSKL